MSFVAAATSRHVSYVEGTSLKSNGSVAGDVALQGAWEVTKKRNQMLESIRKEEQDARRRRWAARRLKLSLFPPPPRDEFSEANAGERIASDFDDGARIANEDEDDGVDDLIAGMRDLDLGVDAGDDAEQGQDLVANVGVRHGADVVFDGWGWSFRGPSTVQSVSFAPNGQLFMITRKDGLEVWGVHDHALKMSWDISNPAAFDCHHDARILWDNERIVAAGKTWIIKTGRVEGRSSLHDEGQYSAAPSQSRKLSFVWPSGGAGRGPPMVHDLVNRTYTLLGKEMGGDYCWHAFSPDDNYILAKFGDCVSGWNVRTGRWVKRCLRWDANVAALAPGGIRALFGRPSAGLELFDLRLGRMKKRLPFSGTNVAFATFAQDGKHILTIAQDGKAMWCNANTLACVAHFQHRAGVVEVKVTPDLTWALIQTCSPGTVHNQPRCSVMLWDLSANSVKELADEPDRIAMDLAPDGKSVITGSAHTARLWHI